MANPIAVYVVTALAPGEDGQYQLTIQGLYSGQNKAREHWQTLEGVEVNGEPTIAWILKWEVVMGDPGRLLEIEGLS